MFSNNFKILVVSGLIILVGSCALSPVERTNKAALEFGFVRQIIQASEFRHVVYLANQAEMGATLHIYLEGDGVPWITPHRISADPTSRSPVMLPLMAMDNNPAVYIGRPCYLGFSNDPGCDAVLWSFGRYSQQVVDSMTEVIRLILSHYEYTSVRLFGHSGGGTLAMLIAQSLPETHTVVTLAGNLDVDAWVKYHHYTPLLGSLDPAKEAGLNPVIYQLHLQASNDEVVPPRLAKKWLAQQTHSDTCLYPGFDHRCCWGNIWPKVLAQMPHGTEQTHCKDD